MGFSEKEIQDKLILLSSHIKGIKLIQELSVPNDQGLQRSRRFDVVQILKDHILVIEIKKNQINLETVAKTLGDKNYVELAKRYFRKKVLFLFTSPESEGIDIKAMNLINLMPNINYIPLESIFNSLYKEYINQLPSVALWRSEEIYKEFHPFITINPLLNNKQTNSFHSNSNNQLSVKEYELCSK